MKYDIIVPTKIETACTGFVIAAEKRVIRSGKERVYRVELHAHAPNVRCFTNGNPTAWEDFSHVGRTMAHALAEFAKSAQKIEQNNA